MLQWVYEAELVSLCAFAMVIELIEMSVKT